MNLRQRKRQLMARLQYIAYNAKWQRYIDNLMEKALAFTPEELAEQEARRVAFWKDLESKMSLRSLVEEPFIPEAGTVLFAEDAEVEAFKTEYIVARKSTGEVVGTFDLKEDADAMIDRARKAKKATLVLV